MPERLLIVEDVIRSRGRGIVLIPEADWYSIPLRVGDPVELRRPDGSSVGTIVRAIECIAPTHDGPRRYAILLSPELEKCDVPPGTEVWTVT